MRPDVFVRGWGLASTRFGAGAGDADVANGDDCAVVTGGCFAGAGSGVGAGFGGTLFGAGVASATTAGFVATLSEIDAFEFVSCRN